MYLNCSQNEPSSHTFPFKRRVLIKTVWNDKVSRWTFLFYSLWHWRVRSNRNLNRPRMGTCSRQSLDAEEDSTSQCSHGRVQELFEMASNLLLLTAQMDQERGWACQMRILRRSIRTHYASTWSFVSYHSTQIHYSLLNRSWSRVQL